MKHAILLSLIFSLIGISTPVTIHAQQGSFGFGKKATGPTDEEKQKAEAEAKKKARKEALREKKRQKAEAAAQKKQEKKELLEAKKKAEEEKLKIQKQEQQKRRLLALSILKNQTIPLENLPEVLDNDNLHPYFSNLDICKTNVAESGRITIFLVKKLNEIPACITKEVIEKQNIWVGILPENAVLAEDLAKKKFIQILKNTPKTSEVAEVAELADAIEDSKETEKGVEAPAKKETEAIEYVNVKAIFQRKLNSTTALINFHINNELPQPKIAVFNQRFFGYILSALDDKRLTFINDEGKSFYFPKDAAVELKIPVKELESEEK